MTLHDVVDEVTVPSVRRGGLPGTVRTAGVGGVRDGRPVAAVAAMGRGSGGPGVDRSAAGPGDGRAPTASPPSRRWRDARRPAPVAASLLHRQDRLRRSRRTEPFTTSGCAPRPSSARPPEGVLARRRRQPAGVVRHAPVRTRATAGSRSLGGAAPFEGAVLERGAVRGRPLPGLAGDWTSALTVRDLETDEVVQAFEASEQQLRRGRCRTVGCWSPRTATSFSGVLAAGVPVPTGGDGYGWQSDVARATWCRWWTATASPASTTSPPAGAAVLVVEVPGSGRLGPGRRGGLTAHLGGPAVRLWTRRRARARLMARAAGRPEAVGVAGRGPDRGGHGTRGRRHHRAASARSRPGVRARCSGLGGDRACSAE